MPGTTERRSSKRNSGGGKDRRRSSKGGGGRSSNSNRNDNDDGTPWWAEPPSNTQHQNKDDNDDESVMSSMYIEDENGIGNDDNGGNNTSSKWGKMPHGRKRGGDRNRPTTSNVKSDRRAKNNNSRDDNYDKRRSSGVNSSRHDNARQSPKQAVVYWTCDACTYRNQLVSTTGRTPLPTHSTCEICGTIHIHDQLSRTTSDRRRSSKHKSSASNQQQHEGEEEIDFESSDQGRDVNDNDEGDSSTYPWMIEDNDQHERPSSNTNRSKTMTMSSMTSMLRNASSVFSLSSSNNAAATKDHKTGRDPNDNERKPKHMKRSSSLSTKRTTSTGTSIATTRNIDSMKHETHGVNDDDEEEQRGGRRHGRSSSRRSNDAFDNRAIGDGGEDTSKSTDMSRNEDVHSNSAIPQYSVSQLVKYLGATEDDVTGLPPALERRVRDFKFARSKRLERHGEQKPWGIYGLYAHLSDIRADLEWAEDAAWRRQRDQPYLSWRDFEDSRDKGLHNRPWFTYTILVLCTIMMIVTLGVNGWKFEPLSVNPLIGPSAETLVKCGARDTNLIVNEGQWYRLFTPMILHAGLVHYVLNMLALWFIGGAVEQSHGFASAAVLFIIPAVGGNILSAICLPQYISVGASGGIFGLIGGCLADITLNWNLLFLKTTTDEKTRTRHVMVLLWLGFDIIINCLLGFTPFVDNFNHLGGFMYGFCCGISTIERLAHGFFGINTDKCSQLGHTIMRFSGLIVSIIAIMVTTIILVQSDGVTSSCHGCRYISCIPFPPNAEEKWWYCDDCDSVTAELFQSTDGSGLYEEIQINCPNDDVTEVLIGDDNITDKEVLRQKLPSYCRMHCEEVFSSK